MITSIACINASSALSQILSSPTLFSGLSENCNKTFSRNDSLNRHLRSCKEKKKDDEDKQNLVNLVNLLNKQLEDQRDQMNKQLEQLDKKDRQIEEIINKKDKQIDELIKKAGINIGTQNIQQNINILAYKNTDISHLTDTDYLRWKHGL